MRRPPRCVSVAISAVEAYHTGMRNTFWAALLLFTGCTVSCLAQFETAAVLGTVRDLGRRGSQAGDVCWSEKLLLRAVGPVFADSLAGERDLSVVGRLITLADGLARRCAFGSYLSQPA